MDTAQIKHYLALRAKRQKIEVEEEEARQAILKEMQTEKVRKAETEYGTFSVAVKQNWIYSPAITKKEDALKLAKVREQNKGIAKSDDTEYLRFTLPKE